MLYGIHSIQRDDDIAVVYVKHPPEIPGVAYMTFGSLADGNVDVDIILQTASVKLSVSGEGMQGKPGVAAKVFKCLWDADVRILNISTSEIKICMLIPKRDADRAYKALLDGFEIV